MKLWLKSQFRKRFSVTDLVMASDHLIKTPPFPPDLLDEMAGTMSITRSGSLLDYWRVVYSEKLKFVSSQPTWETQRRSVLSTILEETSWEALELIVKNVRHVGAWRHMTRGQPGFDDLNDETLKYMRRQRAMIATLNTTSLKELGNKYFGFNNIILNKIEVFRGFHMVIKELDANALDITIDAVSTGKEEFARIVAVFSQNNIVPLVGEQYSNLGRLHEDILGEKFDGRIFRAQLDRFYVRRDALINALQAITKGEALP